MPKKASVSTARDEQKTVKKIPTSDSGVRVLCRTKSGDEYTISQNPMKDRSRFTLWRNLSDGYEKVASADSPSALYQKIDWK